MALQFLQSWYQRQCNGYWEHAYGVTIETLDSPGWMVRIDLADTPLEKESMNPVRRERSEKDWIVCEVAHGRFQGQGDSQKLLEILQVFQAWAVSTRPPP